MEFSEQIIQVIDKIAEKIGIAIDWSQKNILPYMQDLLRRYTTMQIVSNTVAAICFFITGLLSGIIIVHIIKQYSKGNESSIFIKSNSDYYDLFEDGQIGAFGVVALVVSISLILICISCFIGYVNSIIRWITVPEIQLLSDLKGILSEH